MLPHVDLSSSRDELLSLASAYQSELLDDTLPFWLSHAIDTQYGGYLTCLDADGSVIDSDKSVWHQGRFAWLLAKLCKDVHRNDAWLAAAESGIRFLDHHCFDPSDGRMWFQVTRQGQPLRKRRYAYSESFAAIAYAQFSVATGQTKYADKAMTCFQRFLQHNLNPPPGTSKYEQTRPSLGLGFPMIVIGCAHELRLVADDSSLTDAIDSAIATIESKFCKRSLAAVMEVVGPDGEILDHFDGRTLNPGHAIEAAWFIVREGRMRNAPQLIQLGCDMFDWMWERGWDEQNGGLNYFTDLHHGPVQEYWHSMKFWWPHCEALIASLLCYLSTGQTRYIHIHQKIREWSYRHFADPEHGEWYGYLNYDGTRSSSLKGNLWKGPFHLPRMQLLCWKAIESQLTVD